MRKINFRETCRLCDFDKLEKVISLAPSAIADAFVNEENLKEPQDIFPLDLFQCNGCGHVQMLETINPKLLFNDYKYKTSSSPGLVRHFQESADMIISTNNIGKKSLIVEIGSNDGSMLKQFKKRGMKVLGVDPARKIAIQANSEGITTIPEYFSSDLARDITREYGLASIVVANNVFAHIDDIRDVTRGIKHLLHRDGAFVFEVSYLVDILDNFLFDTIYHEHIAFHSLLPLDNFFTSMEMEFYDVRRISTKGGSIRGFVSPFDGNRSKSDYFQKMALEEDHRRLKDPQIFGKFMNSIEARKKELNNVLSEIAEKGKIVAGYGASHTVTTLMHHFDLGKYIEFIVDDNSKKHGLYSPGHHIPIVSPQELYDKKPDYVVILAWNYATPIIEKHQRFIEQGGRFILPLPEVKIHNELH